MLYADNDKRIEENRKDYLYLSRIYAHGKLEDILGIDLLFTNSIELYNDIYNWHHSNGKFIRKHKVTDNKNNIYDVVMYLWRNSQLNQWSGLVCLDNDSESIEDAIKKYTDEATEL